MLLLLLINAIRSAVSPDENIVRDGAPRQNMQPHNPMRSQQAIPAFRSLPAQMEQQEQIARFQSQARVEMNGELRFIPFRGDNLQLEQITFRDQEQGRLQMPIREMQMAIRQEPQYNQMPIRQPQPQYSQMVPIENNQDQSYLPFDSNQSEDSKILDFNPAAVGPENYQTQRMNDYEISVQPQITQNEPTKTYVDSEMLPSYSQIIPNIIIQKDEPVKPTPIYSQLYSIPARESPNVPTKFNPASNATGTYQMAQSTNRPTNVPNYTQISDSPIRNTESQNLGKYTTTSNASNAIYNIQTDYKPSKDVYNSNSNGISDPKRSSGNAVLGVTKSKFESSASKAFPLAIGFLALFL